MHTPSKIQNLLNGHVSSEMMQLPEHQPSDFCPGQIDRISITSPTYQHAEYTVFYSYVMGSSTVKMQCMGSEALGGLTFLGSS